MKLLSFNFTKILAEKQKELGKDIKIVPNIDISEISEVKNDFIKTKDSLMGVNFSFNISYNPDYAKISLQGNLILGIDSKLIKEVLKSWKDKKINQEIQLPLLNLIVKKSTLKALDLEDQIGLPLHMPLANLKASDNSNKE